MLILPTASLLRIATKILQTNRRKLPVITYDGITRLILLLWNDMSSCCGVYLFLRYGICRFGVPVRGDDDQYFPVFLCGEPYVCLYHHQQALQTEKNFKWLLISPMCSVLCIWAVITDRGVNVVAHARIVQLSSRSVVSSALARVAG